MMVRRTVMMSWPCLRAVDVAADVQAVLGGVFAGEAAGDFLLGFQRPDAALADVVLGPDRGVAGESQHLGLPFPAELQQVTARVPAGGVLRTGDARDVGETRQHCV